MVIFCMWKEQRRFIRNLIARKAEDYRARFLLEENKRIANFYPAKIDEIIFRDGSQDSKVIGMTFDILHLIIQKAYHPKPNHQNSTNTASQYSN